MRRRRTRCRSYEIARPVPVAQLGFFGDSRQVLVDDETGSITYVPSAVDPDTGRAWFNELRESVPWRSERRRMYDRDVDVPRLVAGYRLGSDDAPPAVIAAVGRGTELTGAAFNSVGLNYYRDARDSVAPHNDHLYEIVAGFPIALLSLGASRTMTIRSKQKPRKNFDIDLEPGSFLIMSYETQLNYDHGIPKSKTPVEPRISVAMRVRP